MKQPALRVLYAVALVAGTIAVAAGGATQAVATGSSQVTCIAHPFHYSEKIDIAYSPGCTGHDEPELDPVSNLPGSARDLTWTAILPTDGTIPVSATGPTFWWGGTVSDPDSLFKQAFLEVQFYPDSLVSRCTAGGGFVVTQAPNTYTACSPVWQIEKIGGNYVEDAAFNAMLGDGSGGPLVMHAGDHVKVHFFVTAAKDGWHVNVADLTTHQEGTIVLNSKDHGPLMPTFGKQRIGNSLGWGIVHDTPASFVWEIGHSDLYGDHPGKFCLPGQTYCGSYEASYWAATKPLQLLSVRWANGHLAKTWAVVSDYGGVDEIRHYCRIYGAPYCTYPWYAFNGNGFTYGVDFQGTRDDFGQAAQFVTQTGCGGPFGRDSTYCDTVVKSPH